MKKLKNNEIKTLKCYRCGHKWIPRQNIIVQCPKCKSAKFDLPKIKSRIPQNSKKRLRGTEGIAYSYLKSKGIDVNLDISKQSNGQPDFITNKGMYEIKTANSKIIGFTKAQWEKFDDSVNILIFKIGNKLPIIECKMKDIRKAYNKNRNIGGNYIIIK